MCSALENFAVVQFVSELRRFSEKNMISIEKYSISKLIWMKLNDSLLTLFLILLQLWTEWYLCLLNQFELHQSENSLKIIFTAIFFGLQKLELVHTIREICTGHHGKNGWNCYCYTKIEHCSLKLHVWTNGFERTSTIFIHLDEQSPHFCFSVDWKYQNSNQFKEVQ